MPSGEEQGERNHRRSRDGEKDWREQRMKMLFHGDTGRAFSSAASRSPHFLPQRFLIAILHISRSASPRFTIARATPPLGEEVSPVDWAMPN